MADDVAALVDERLAELGDSEALAAPLDLPAVTEALADLDPGAALEVLDGLLQDAADVEDPTTWVIEAARAMAAQAEEEVEVEVDPEEEPAAKRPRTVGRAPPTPLPGGVRPPRPTCFVPPRPRAPWREPVPVARRPPLPVAPRAVGLRPPWAAWAGAAPSGAPPRPPGGKGAVARPVRKRPDMCRQFQRGRCAAGAACAFAHSEAEQERALALQLVMLDQQVQKFKTRICSYWRSGSCHRGDLCSFAHGAEELEQPVRAPGVPAPRTPPRGGAPEAEAEAWEAGAEAEEADEAAEAAETAGPPEAAADDFEGEAPPDDWAEDGDGVAAPETPPVPVAAPSTPPF